MNRNMKGLILCGGKGTRLAPITHHQPKSMVPVGNQTMVEREVLAMRKAGIEEVGLIVQNGASAEIEALIGDGSKYGVQVSYFYQYKPDGTASAVQRALPFMAGHSIAICLGDNLMGEHISELIASFPEQGADAIVVTQEVDNPKDFGIVEVQDDQVKSIEEKPEFPRSNRALTGISWFSAGNIEKFINLVKSRRNEYDLTDIFEKVLKEEGILKSLPLNTWWLDAGTPDRLLEANQRVLEERTASLPSQILLEDDDIQLENCKITGPVVIGKGARLKNAVIGPYTAIGKEVKLTNTQANNSIIMDNTQIADFSTQITDSIIGGNLTLHKGMLSSEIGKQIDHHAIVPIKVKLQLMLEQYTSGNRVPDLQGVRKLRNLPLPPKIEMEYDSGKPPIVPKSRNTLRSLSEK